MSCGGLSRSRRLGASSPLRAKLSVLPCVGIWNLVDRLTCGGLAEGPLVWLSICACVEDGGQDWDEDGHVRKISGRGTGCEKVPLVLPPLMILG